ncbi:MAG TPA: GNAT family N-acetyltransferase [Flavobacterium sp.]|uniref:Acetyltransferase (GNAT) domain-containing protein n=1 Tax=Paenimyroides marinum TaxID=1159016 RepID=A0A1H6L7X5_9FLAO|nr:GNAT family N-acetyltransferase [Paenimyroides aquimaris]SEH80591.1 Acetyltransferase (GNAT) domain-containing protein [Paenimyroides aquimaris]HLV50622.1 GNAT family N-acetyltransferase [Flavobacterium sp.]
MIELLDKKHNRNDFDCGKELLNNYLKKQAGQDQKRKLSVCFVLSQPVTNNIQGYYTLSNNSIPLSHFPENIQKKLPKSYLSIPTTLLGRLAIDKTQQGKGIGKILLIDALKRSYEISQEIGSFAVVVDPIDKEAEVFYEKYDFIKLPDSEKMIIATKTLKELFG